MEMFLYTKKNDSKSRRGKLPAGLPPFRGLRALSRPLPGRGRLRRRPEVRALLAASAGGGLADAGGRRQAGDGATDG